MKKRSLNFKLVFVMLILMAGSIAIAGIGLSRLSNMKAAVYRIVEEESARVSLAKDVQALFYVQLINEKSYILEDDAKEMAGLDERIKNRHEQIGEKIKALEAISSDIGKQDVVDFSQIYHSWWENMKEIKVQTAGGHRDVAKLLSQTKNHELRKKGEKVIEHVVGLNEKQMHEEEEAMDHSYAEARSLMTLVSIFAIVLGGGIGAFVLTSLSRNINGVIENLSTSSGHVSAASQQIAMAATELSEATTEQASSLEETVATIEELSSMVKVNADNAQSASEFSTEATNIAVRGEKEMNTLVAEMDEISKDSKKISDIINVIDDIAFQTNLLALNAAVEAARAGEQGKGFAVVAEAVRTLSQRSSAAAKDISDLIRSSVERISLGSEQAKKSGMVLGDIVEAVKKVTQLNQEIAAASSEQSNGITQISKAMNQMDQVTQVNAASSEEAAASAEELSAQAETLSHVIATLVESIKGDDKKVDSKQPKFTVGRVEQAPVSEPPSVDHGQKAVSLVRRIAKAKANIPGREQSKNNEDLLPLDSAS